MLLYQYIKKKENNTTIIAFLKHYTKPIWNKFILNLNCSFGLISIIYTNNNYYIYILYQSSFTREFGEVFTDDLI